MRRRDLLKSATGTAALAQTQAQTQPKSIDWSRVRQDFPWIGNRLWLTAADYHPLSIRSIHALEKHIRSRGYGDGEGSPFGAEERETRRLFASLIGATPEEVAFVQSTTEGENIVAAGLGLGQTKGNVVIDSLHYQATKFMYREMQREGRIELRVVQHRERNGVLAVHAEDVERSIDRNTKLVSIALVSNINGYLHDIRRTAAAAHANGAILYADIIQGAGSTPIDVKAMGIDCAACGAYKWLMGDFGFGFLYVREDLQDKIIRRSRYGVRQFRSPTGAQADSLFEIRPGAARYETGSLSYAGGTCAHAALQYIHELGVDNIRAHSRELTSRLQKELPRMGYEPMTPEDNNTSIVSFRLKDYRGTGQKLRKIFGRTVIALRNWEFTDASGKASLLPGMRISPSVYNNQADIDRLLEALS